MSKDLELVHEVREAIEIAYMAKLNHQLLDGFARQKYNEIFKDLKREHYTLHYYLSYEAIGFNKIRIKYYSNLKGAKYETIDVEI
jgi:hypothetical protein